MAAPITDERNISGTTAISVEKIFSNNPINKVVNAEPTSVFPAIEVPRTKKARTISERLIATENVPGERGKYVLRITAIPLVPPRSKAFGNMKTTVAKAYIMLLIIISP